MGAQAQAHIGALGKCRRAAEAHGPLGTAATGKPHTSLLHKSLTPVSCTRLLHTSPTQVSYTNLLHKSPTQVSSYTSHTHTHSLHLSEPDSPTLSHRHTSHRESPKFHAQLEAAREHGLGKFTPKGGHCDEGVQWGEEMLLEKRGVRENEGGLKPDLELETLSGREGPVSHAGALKAARGLVTGGQDQARPGALSERETHISARSPEALSPPMMLAASSYLCASDSMASHAASSAPEHLHQARQLLHPPHSSLHRLQPLPQQWAPPPLAPPPLAPPPLAPQELAPAALHRRGGSGSGSGSGRLSGTIAKAARLELLEQELALARTGAAGAAALAKKGSRAAVEMGSDGWGGDERENRIQEMVVGLVEGRILSEGLTPPEAKSCAEPPRQHEQAPAGGVGAAGCPPSPRGDQAQAAQCLPPQQRPAHPHVLSEHGFAQRKREATRTHEHANRLASSPMALSAPTPSINPACCDVSPPPKAKIQPAPQANSQSEVLLGSVPGVQHPKVQNAPHRARHPPSVPRQHMAPTDAPPHSLPYSLPQWRHHPAHPLRPPCIARSPHPHDIARPPAAHLHDVAHPPHLQADRRGQHSRAPPPWWMQSPPYAPHLAVPQNLTGGAAYQTHPSQPSQPPHPNGQPTPQMLHQPRKQHPLHSTAHPPQLGTYPQPSQVAPYPIHFAHPEIPPMLHMPWSRAPLYPGALQLLSPPPLSPPPEVDDKKAQIRRQHPPPEVDDKKAQIRRQHPDHDLSGATACHSPGAPLALASVQPSPLLQPAHFTPLHTACKAGGFVKPGAPNKPFATPGSKRGPPPKRPKKKVPVMSAAEVLLVAMAGGTTLARAYNQTGYKGVTRVKCSMSRPFQARIRRHGELKHLGSYSTAEEAALAYANARNGLDDDAALRSGKRVLPASGTNAQVGAVGNSGNSGASARREDGEDRDEDSELVHEANQQECGSRRLKMLEAHRREPAQNQPLGDERVRGVPSSNTDRSSRGEEMRGGGNKWSIPELIADEALLGESGTSEDGSDGECSDGGGTDGGGTDGGGTDGGGSDGGGFHGGGSNAGVTRGGHMGVALVDGLIPQPRQQGMLWKRARGRCEADELPPTKWSHGPGASIGCADSRVPGVKSDHLRSVQRRQGQDHPGARDSRKGTTARCAALDLLCEAALGADE